MGTYSLSKGGQFDLCQALERGLAQLPPIVNISLCEAPLEPGNSDFQRPIWEAIDPLANLDVVKEIYTWSRYPGGREIQPYLDEMRRSRSTPQHIIDEVWAPVEQDVLALIEAGVFHLQRAHFDINHDGKSETVYRMSIIGRYRTVDGFGPAKIHQCSPVPGNEGKQVYNFFLLERDDPIGSLSFRKYTNSILDAFLYRGRVYLANVGWIGYYVQEPTHYLGEGGIILPSEVCGFNFRRQEP